MDANHTFVICAYKENPFLEDTILSLKRQTVKSPLVLSTSTPNDYLTEMCRKHDIAMTVNTSPHLVGDDWNHAYDHATTKLVTLAHQDDIYEEDYLESVLAAFADDVLLVHTDYYEIRGEQKVTNNRLLAIKRLMNAPFRVGTLNKSRFVKRRILSLGCSICCPAVTFNKQLAGARIFDTSYINSSDYQTWVDLADKAGRFVYVPKAVLGHRIYAESATTLNLEHNIRKDEDLEVLRSLWPAPLAKVVNNMYALSEKSNKH
jgi:hypothetical protein